jgi:hypothetical protein
VLRLACEAVSYEMPNQSVHLSGISCVSRCSAIGSPSGAENSVVRRTNNHSVNFFYTKELLSQNKMVLVVANATYLAHVPNLLIV